MSKRSIFQPTKAQLSQIILCAKNIFRTNKDNVKGSEISWGKAMRISWARWKFRQLLLHTTLKFTFLTESGEIREATAVQGRIYKAVASSPFTIGYFDKLRNAPRKFRLDRLVSIDNIKGTKLTRIDSCTSQNVIKVNLEDAPKQATNTGSNGSAFARMLAANNAPLQTKSQTKN